MLLPHGDYHCDPGHVQPFGPLAEPEAPTGYEPTDLIGMNNTQVTPLFLDLRFG